MAAPHATTEARDRANDILRIYQDHACTLGHETAVVLILDPAGNCVDQFGFDAPGSAALFRGLIEGGRALMPEDPPTERP